MRQHTKSSKKQTVRRIIVSAAILLLLVGLLGVFLLKGTGRVPTKLRSILHITLPYGAAQDVAWTPAVPDDGVWNLQLVNPWNEIPNGYSPALTTLSNGQSVDERIYPALQAMFDTMRQENVCPIVVSGYRTQDYQQGLLDDEITKYENEGYSAEAAATVAKTWVAVPGTSEHQLGLAVDIGADTTKSTDEEVYTWLAENAYRFGFILRYPEDKTALTGISYEPWHYRYVGVEAAAKIYRSGICLEEYLG
ncbi:MAG: M15 family metallopeptidase [Oscillospiraceae bacterium]|nr:M15 family metallopeptidase [Oscillospiraceae bacterium]